jgi:hypothetical protein
VDQTQVYLIQQTSAHEQPEILKWDTLKNNVTHVMTIPATGKLLPDSDTENTSGVSPDGRYFIITLNSLIGDGSDVWGCDTSTNRAVVALAGWAGHPTAWARQSAIVRCYPDTQRDLQVDLQTGRAHEIKVPIRGKEVGR